MAEIIYKLGDLVGDSDAQFGVIFEEDRALVMYRDGNGYRPVVKSVKTNDLLPLHQETVKNISSMVKLALLSVITAMSLPNHLPPTVDIGIPNHNRDKKG